MIDICCKEVEISGKTDALISEASWAIIETAKTLAKRSGLPEEEVFELLHRFTKANYLRDRGMDIEQSKKESGLDKYLHVAAKLVCADQKGK